MAEMSVAALGNGKSEVTITMNFVPKFVPLGALMGVLITKLMMREIFFQALQGLDHHARTGELIGKGGVAVLLETLMHSAGRTATA